MRLAFLASAAVIALPSIAVAHGVWIAERWGELGVVYGHGAGDDPYDPDKIIYLKSFDKDGRELAIGIDKAERHALLATTGEPAVILLDLDNGIYSKAPDGASVNRPRREVPGATAANHSVKHSLAVVDLHGPVPRLPAQPLQILPLSNPVEAKAGDELRLRVLLDGKPLPGARILVDYTGNDEEEATPTDAAGETAVRIARNGLNVLAVSHVEPLAGNPDADQRTRTATLSFVAGGAHEH